MKRIALNEEILDAFLPMDLYERAVRLAMPHSFALGVTMEDGEDDDPAGMIVCTEDEDRLVIEWLYVMPDYRGNGIGSELLYLAFCEGEARGFVDAAARVSEEYETNDYGWNPKSFFDNDVFSGKEEGECVWRISFQELEKLLVQDEKKNESSAKNVTKLSKIKDQDLQTVAEALADRFDGKMSMPVIEALRLANPETSFLLKKGNDYAGVLLVRKVGQIWYPYELCAVDEEAAETLVRAALYFSEDVCLPKDEIEIAVRTVSTKRLLQKIGLPGRVYEVTYYLCKMKDFTKRKAELADL